MWNSARPKSRWFRQRTLSWRSRISLRLGAEVRDANGHPIEEVEFNMVVGDQSVATIGDNGVVTAVGTEP